MEQREGKIKSFTDLIAWQKGHVFVVQIYKETRKFPKAEIFGLVSQMRRCAVSITSNIAEGFSRKSYKEKNQFYYISKGSLTEIQNQLLIAKDVQYIVSFTFNELAKQTVEIHKLINGLIKSSKAIPKTKNINKKY